MSDAEPGVWRRLFGRSTGPTTIPESKHDMSRRGVSRHAAQVMKQLRAAGFSAYLVGGSVRDLLVGLAPKDFDVVTDAEPEEIRRVFRYSRIIGRRFRLVHVYGRERGDIIEVSTFRANSQATVHVANDSDADEMPMVVDDNTYGTIEEDAWRRDFTINALFYNDADNSVVDFTTGMQDIKRRVVRMIGDPAQRFHEDPVRLLRAIRMAAKLDFSIEKKMYRDLLALPGLLQHVAAARLFDEIGKLFFTGHAQSSYSLLTKTGYFQHLFPLVHAVIADAKEVKHAQLLTLSMVETDSRYKAGHSLNPGYLFAVLYWPVVQQEQRRRMASGARLSQALPQAIRATLELARKRLAIPKRHQAMMRAIWSLQYHLKQQRPQRVARLLAHRYCRAAVDFFELRVRAGWEDGAVIASAWRKRVGSRPTKARRPRGRNKPERRSRDRRGARTNDRHQSSETKQMPLASSPGSSLDRAPGTVRVPRLGDRRRPPAADKTHDR